MGHCQQNVRELVEAVAYGRERVWGEASCCATATNQRIRAQGYTSVDFSHALPGDLVYFGPGGGRCGTCHQDPGHVGISAGAVGDDFGCEPVITRAGAGASAGGRLARQRQVQPTPMRQISCGASSCYRGRS